MNNIDGVLWPVIDLESIEDTEITLPIQINGKMVTTIKVEKNYNFDEIFPSIVSNSKINDKIFAKKLIKKINVQNKIINLIFN